MCPSSTTSSESDASEGCGNPEKAPGPRWQWSVLVFFFTMLAGTAVVDALWPLAAAVPVGREGEQAAARKRGRRFSDGSLFRAIESEIGDRSRVRGYVGPIWCAWLYRAFRETGGNTVAGRGDWLFMRDRIQRRRATDAAILSFAVESIGAVNERIAGLGSRLVLILVPRKETSLEEMLPVGVDPDAALGRLLVAALRRAGIEVIDPYPRFRETRDPALYHHFDSHWNDEGMRVTAEMTARETGLLAAPENRLGRLEVTEQRPEPGDILNLMGAVRANGAGDPVWLKRPLFSVIRLKGEGPERKAEDGAVPVLVGTSFSYNNRFPDYLAHYIGRPVERQALPGVGPVRPFIAFLASRKGRELPQVVFWEVPEFDLLCYHRPLDELLELLRALDARRGR